MTKKPKGNRRATSYPFPLVEVLWDDAEVDGTGWEEVPKELTETHVLTIGFLVKETDKHLLIASSYDPDNKHTNSRVKIPKGMVHSMVVLK